MARSPVEILRDAGIPFVLHEHEPVATVAEILEALPFPAEEHVKTLAFAAERQVVLVALRGCDRLRFGDLSRAIGVGRDRIAPLPRERIEAELGLQPGGVCPICDAEVTVLIDDRVARMPRVLCGSGRSDATLELASADLVRASRGDVVALAAH